MITQLNSLFIDTIPDELEQGILYISIKYRVIIHSCCCGCKNKVVTPLSPVRWKMTFDGKNVSLYPSIGNWNFECQSHYWIKNNEIVWDRKWTKDEIKRSKIDSIKRRSRFFKSPKRKSKK